MSVSDSEMEQYLKQKLHRLKPEEAPVKDVTQDVEEADLPFWIVDDVKAEDDNTYRGTF